MEIKKLLAEVVKQENWGESAISLFWTDDVPRRDGAAAYDERPPEKVICLHSPKGAEAMNPDNPIVNVPPTVRRRFKMVPLDESNMDRLILEGDENGEHLRLEHNPTKGQFNLVIFLKAGPNSQQHQYNRRGLCTLPYSSIRWAKEQMKE